VISANHASVTSVMNFDYRGCLLLLVSDSRVKSHKLRYFATVEISFALFAAFIRTWLLKNARYCSFSLSASSVRFAAMTHLRQEGQRSPCRRDWITIPDRRRISESMILDQQRIMLRSRATVRSRLTTNLPWNPWWLFSSWSPITINPHHLRPLIGLRDLLLCPTM